MVYLSEASRLGPSSRKTSLGVSPKIFCETPVHLITKSFAEPESRVRTMARARQKSRRKLVVELDAGQHNLDEHSARDVRRDELLQSILDSIIAQGRGSGSGNCSAEPLPIGKCSNRSKNFHLRLPCPEGGGWLRAERAAGWGSMANQVLVDILVVALAAVLFGAERRNPSRPRPSCRAPQTSGWRAGAWRAARTWRRSRPAASERTPTARSGMQTTTLS